MNREPTCEDTARIRKWFSPDIKSAGAWSWTSQSLELWDINSCSLLKHSVHGIFVMAARTDHDSPWDALFVQNVGPYLWRTSAFPALWPPEPPTSAPHTLLRGCPLDTLLWLSLLGTCGLSLSLHQLNCRRETASFSTPPPIGLESAFQVAHPS